MTETIKRCRTRKQTIADCELARKCLTNFAAVDAENASTAQSKAVMKLERLQTERTARTQQDKKIALFIRTFKKLPETMTEWDDTTWTVMVEKAIVHKGGGVTFVLRMERKLKLENAWEKVLFELLVTFL